jgi:hypothetical protein
VAAGDRTEIDGAGVEPGAGTGQEEQRYAEADDEPESERGSSKLPVRSTVRDEPASNGRGDPEGKGEGVGGLEVEWAEGLVLAGPQHHEEGSQQDRERQTHGSRPDRCHAHSFD